MMPQNRLQNSQQSTQQPSYTIDPNVFSMITLDDISLKLNKLVDLSITNQKTLASLLNYTVKNEKRLEVIQDQLLEDADEGQLLRLSGTVTTTQFTIIDTMAAPGHMVKAYTVKNDGPNNIYVAHNVAVSSEVDADIVDVTSNVSRFNIVEPNEDIKFTFNRQRIRNVHILASGGDSQFRAWLVW
jgi:hypothetical protein